MEESVSETVAFEKRPEEGNGVQHAVVRGKNLLGRGLQVQRP